MYFLKVCVIANIRFNHIHLVLLWLLLRKVDRRGDLFVDRLAARAAAEAAIQPAEPAEERTEHEAAPQEREEPGEDQSGPGADNDKGE